MSEQTKSEVAIDLGNQADQRALARCESCWEDGEGTDVGPSALARLVQVGWLHFVGDGEYEITRLGARKLQDIGL